MLDTTRTAKRKFWFYREGFRCKFRSLRAVENEYSVKAKILFPDELFAALKKSKTIRVRAGTGDHRFIGVWFVIVGSRVVARSWSVKPNGWYSTFRCEPGGAVRIGKREIAIRALPISGKRLRDAVDHAYLKKYNTGWELKYAKDLTREISRATTIEFVATRRRTGTRKKLAEPG